MYTFIYKTNISSGEALKELRSILQKHDSSLSWSIDTEDIDNVLRIRSIANNSVDIVNVIKNAGYHCEELPD